MKDSNQTICPKCAAIISDDAPGGLCPLCALEGAATVSSTTSVGRNITPPSIAELSPHFPDLEILELLGAGGMGAVYKARQPQLDRFVALKILSHHLASDPAFVERFNREARVLGRLSHPNIVGIHDFGTAGPYCYLMMEYVDGVNLRQAMRAGRFTPTEALEMVQHLCSALKFAHEEGVLHRDIKPENILLDSKGRIKVADFGIAKLVGEDRQYDITLTMQGSVLGSPHYMAPEQIETPGDVDQRADIYSLGVVLYELLTGGLPIGRFALPSEKASMDARIDHIVMRTLEKEREARFQTAAEVGNEVQAVTMHPAAPSKKITAANAEPVAARYSLKAAILTGTSIPLVFITLIVVSVMFLTLRSSASISESGGSTWPAKQGILGSFIGILAILGVLVGFASAIMGFILGAIALADIRRSGGVKTGIGSSVFAVSAWPILFIAFIAFIAALPPILLLEQSMGKDTQMKSMVAFIGWILSVIAASWILIRALYRWAMGAVRKDGSRFQPGLALPLFMVVLLSFGGPLLTVTIANSFQSNADSRGHHSRFMDEPPKTVNVSSSSAFQSNRIDWRLGESELSIPLSIHSDIRAEFFIVLKDGQGTPIKYSKIGTCQNQNGSQTRREFQVRIGTLGSVSGDSTEGGFAGHMNLTGESGEILGVPDIGKWRIEAFQDPAVLNSFHGTASIRVGERHETIDGTSKLTGLLELEVRAVQVK